MFRQLKEATDLIRAAICIYKEFRSSRERNKVVVDVLKFYFLLKDCVDDGEQLVHEAGNNPVAKIKAMDGDNAVSTLTRWDLILSRQGTRLNMLANYISGDHHLAVIDPKLQGELSKVIGYKMQRIFTLHGLGATLFFRKHFPIQETNETKARLVAFMAGQQSRRKLDLSKINQEITSLRDSLDKYHEVVKRLIPDEIELVRLSRKARQATTLRVQK